MPPIVMFDPATKGQRTRAVEGIKVEDRSVSSRAMRSVLIAVMLTVAGLGGCMDRREAEFRAAADNLYPPAPAIPRVAGLGNLRIGPPPTELNRELSRLLLGTEEEPTIGLIKPTTITIRDKEVLICDSVLRAIVSWNPDDVTLSALALRPRPERPVAAQVADDGGILVVDAGANQVLRYDANGKRLRTYEVSRPDFKPAFALQVENEIWVSSIGAATVERFDLSDGHAIGALRGPEPPQGPFVMPYGLARMPGGEVLVVDMLAPTVHVFSSTGRWLRRFGSAGDRPGYFGRPKYAAVAADGTIFVSDAGLQRIHAFDAQGRPLMALGESKQRANRLTVPAGLAVGSAGLLRNQTLPDGFRTDVALLAAEQITNPGVRAFAWGEGQRPGGGQGNSATLAVNARGTMNPHWSRDGCSVCHREGSAPRAIKADAAQGLCLSCHDGVKAVQEFHPVERVANRDPIHTPSDWPTVDGRLTCLTCHDIAKSCREMGERTDENIDMLRVFDLQAPFAICTTCHLDQAQSRINPHRSTGNTATDAQMCGYCHTSDLKESPNGRRDGAPALRARSSSVCLTCHSKHWDYFAPGHVERAIPGTIAANLARPLGPEQAGENSGGTLRWSDILPTSDGRVACYTCHNPHPAGAYSVQSPLGMRSVASADNRFNFRIERSKLCYACHNK